MASTLTLDWNVTFKFSMTSIAESNGHFQFWSHQASLWSFNPLITPLPSPTLVLSSPHCTVGSLSTSNDRSLVSLHELHLRCPWTSVAHCSSTWHNLSESSHPVSWFQSPSLSSGPLPWAIIWLSMCLLGFPTNNSNLGCPNWNILFFQTWNVLSSILLLPHQHTCTLLD